MDASRLLAGTKHKDNRSKIVLLVAHKAWAGQ